MSNRDVEAEAVVGILASGTASNPISVACHLLHEPSFVAMAKKYLVGDDLHVRFFMRADDMTPPETVTVFAGADAKVVLDCLDAMACVRSAFVQ